MKRQPSECEKIFANEAADKGINLQNIQTTHAAQKKKKKHSQKMGRRSNYTFLRRGHTDG